MKAQTTRWVGLLGLGVALGCAPSADGTIDDDSASDVAGDDLLHTTGLPIERGTSVRVTLESGGDEHRFRFQVPDDGETHAYAFSIEGLGVFDSAAYLDPFLYAWSTGTGLSFPELRGLETCDESDVASRCGTGFKGADYAPVDRRYLGEFEPGTTVYLAVARPDSDISIDYDLGLMELADAESCDSGLVALGEVASYDDTALQALWLDNGPPAIPSEPTTIEVGSTTGLYDLSPFAGTWFAGGFEYSGWGRWESSSRVVRPGTSITLEECRVETVGDIGGFHPVVCAVSVGACD